MKNQIVVATHNGFARFLDGTVDYVEEAKNASQFSDHRLATVEAARHGLIDGFILVDVSHEIATASALA